MNRVDEEFGGNPRFLLIPSKAEEAKAGNEHDRRIGIPQLWRVVCGKAVVVLLVFDAIFADLFMNPRSQIVRILDLRIPGDKHRADARTQKMIRTTCTETTKLARRL